MGVYVQSVVYGHIPRQSLTRVRSSGVESPNLTFTEGDLELQYLLMSMLRSYCWAKRSTMNCFGLSLEASGQLAASEHLSQIWLHPVWIGSLHTPLHIPKLYRLSGSGVAHALDERQFQLSRFKKFWYSLVYRDVRWRAENSSIPTAILERALSIYLTNSLSICSCILYAWRKYKCLCPVL